MLFCQTCKFTTPGNFKIFRDMVVVLEHGGGCTQFGTHIGNRRFPRTAYGMCPGSKVFDNRIGATGYG